MSDYIALRCDTCGVELGRPELPEHLTRNGDKEIRALIADAPRLLAFWHETRGEYELHAWWGRVPLVWLELHEGHALRPISEYEPRPGTGVDSPS